MLCAYFFIKGHQHLVHLVFKSYHPFNNITDQVEEHLEVLLDVLKEWIQKVYVKKTHYLKLKNKNATLKKLNQTLQERVAELQGSSS